MSLSDATCRAAKPGPRTRKLSDGAGLQLWIYPNGSRLWRIAYRFSGKQKLLALGAYPTVSLCDARDLREQAKKLLAKDIDPSEAKKKAKAVEAAKGITFRTVAEGYLEKLRREGRATATLKKIDWLFGFAYPELGDRIIAEIRPADVLVVLRQVEGRGRYESARRLQSTIGSVFRYAVATAQAETDPTFALRGVLARPPVKPRAAITDPKAFGALLRAIDGFEGQPTTQAALKLMAILFPRPGELRAAEWPEFDLDAAVWTIPAARMKMRRAHRVPLPRQALAILNELQPITGKGKFVFPSIRSAFNCMSAGTPNAALRRLGYTSEEATAHGFRATASTLLNESGRWNADAIERQLAHIENDEVRRVYARGEYWDERIKIMAWWADHLDNLKLVGKVVKIGPRLSLI